MSLRIDTDSADGLSMRLAAALDSSQKQNLTVTVASGYQLDVREFEVEERMSKLFSVKLRVMSRDADLDFAAIVGLPASFAINGAERRGSRSRVWRGICQDIKQLAVEERGLSTYELTIVPTLWLLTQRRNYRIFQQVSEIDMVTTILGEWSIAPVLRLTGSYKPREYRVQYGESDFAFISRMLEDAGVSFFFEPSGEDTTLVLSDAPQAGEARELAVPYRENPTTADRDHVTKVMSEQQIRPGRYTVRDYDTRLPADYPLKAGAKSVGASVEDRLEVFEYQPGAFLFGGAAGGGTPTADDRGTARSDEREAQRIAERRLDAQRGARRSCRFETSASDLGPGVVFVISEHARADFAAARLLVIGSTHSGTSLDSWVQRCEARFADTPFRPAHDTPKPKTAGVECATVVGPPGEEIHTDEFGRVRVAFHWDRESKADQNSSCWIHSSQPWGGAGYGGTALPRVGQEVIVDFLAGDPDRPIITGRVYTNQQKTPYTLPHNKTQSGLKSSSSPATGGYNELMFEDAAGRELVRMQAEKDLKKLVKHDESVIIGNDRQKLVRHDDALTVNNDRTKKVDRDEQITIGHDRSERVKNDERVTIDGNRTKAINKNERHAVALNRTRMVGVNESVTVGVVQTVNIGKNHNLTIGKSQKVKVKKTATETVGVAKALTVGMAYQVSVGVSMNTTVGMTQTEQIGLTKKVDVGEKLELVCGKSSIKMEKEGRITLAIEGGATVVLDDKSIVVAAAAGGVVVVQGGPNVHINP
jgi:type VI secretion system secreted protein VgrG